MYYISVSMEISTSMHLLYLFSIYIGTSIIYNHRCYNWQGPSNLNIG